MSSPVNFWGKLVTNIRAEQGISQRKLSVMASVNRSTLRRIEDGTARGEIEVIETLLNTLGYELEALRHEAVDERNKLYKQMAEDPKQVGKVALKNLLTIMPIRNPHL